jgi:hypothetical protein
MSIIDVIDISEDIDIGLPLINLDEEFQESSSKTNERTSDNDSHLDTLEINSQNNGDVVELHTISPVLHFL